MLFSLLLAHFAFAIMPAVPNGNGKEEVFLALPFLGAGLGRPSHSSQGYFLCAAILPYLPLWLSVMVS